MLHFIPPVIERSRHDNHITYWKLTISLPNVNPLEFKVSSIKQLSDILGIKETTLRKIVYTPNYNSKRYNDFLKHITLTAHYD